MDCFSATDCFFFDDAERAVVGNALSAVSELDPEQAALLLANFRRLSQAAAIVRDCPPIGSLRGRGSRPSFSSESLIELLCRVPDYDIDLNIPTKAVLGQAYLVAKINFLKSLLYALENVGADAAHLDGVEVELGQAIHSKLAEELVVSIVTDPRGEPKVKRAAAQSLFRIWEERLTTEIDDFAPYLESIWRARDKVRPVLGTMRGTHEFFRLVAEARDGRVLEYFSAEDIPEEQSQAFEEFLFGLSYEEIARLRAHLVERGVSVVSVDDAQQLLGRHKESLLPTAGAQAFYTSYKRRRVQASYRTLTNTAGPKRTAEEYVMIAFLMRGIAS